MKLLKVPSLGSASAAWDSLKNTGKPTSLDAPQLQVSSEVYKGWLVVLEGRLGVCLLTCDMFLGHCIGGRKAGRGTPTSTTLNYLLSDVKEKNSELRMIYSRVLRNVSTWIRSGFENCWARRRLDLKARLPRFRRVEEYNSMTYPWSGFFLKGGVLSGMGELKIARAMMGEV